VQAEEPFAFPPEADSPAFGEPAPRAAQRIDIVNFAKSEKLQSLPTAHRCPMLELEYSPSSAHLLSCSADAVQVRRDRGLLMISASFT
jgi:hypothetical protein